MREPLGHASCRLGAAWAAGVMRRGMCLSAASRCPLAALVLGHSAIHFLFPPKWKAGL
jgi:hypothetical protein